MSMQKKLSSLAISPYEKQYMGKVLDLELKYMDILWGLFTSNDFILDLKMIEYEIQNQYCFLNHKWDLKNKLKVPAERLTKQYVYRNLSHLIEHIYPSPISSDIAFITRDAVINIDIKTLDIVGNRSDIYNLQFENNQSSFINKNLDEDPDIQNSGVKVECLLPKEYSFYNEVPKIMLTYFLTIIYRDDTTSFSLSRDPKLATIHLKCLPNGIISSLFDYDIVQNFKTYSYFKSKDGFEPIFLTNNPHEVNNKIKEIVESNSSLKLINGRQKIGIYYKSYGVSLFPVKRDNQQYNGYYLEAVKNGHTIRVPNNTLIYRFDSLDNLWYGVRMYNIQ